MIKLKFSGEAEVVRAEMLALLGMSETIGADRPTDVSIFSARGAAEGLAPASDQTTSGQQAEAEQAPAAVTEPAKRGRGKAKETPTDAPKQEPSASEPSAPSASASAASEAPAAAAESQDPVAATDAPAGDEPAAAAPTLAEVRSALEVFGKSHGPTPMIALLKDFGARRVSDVPVERYSELLGVLRSKSAA